VAKKKTSTKKAPAKKTAKKPPAKKTSAKKTSAKKTSAKKTSAKKTSAKKTSAKKTSKKAPAKKTSKKAPAKKTSKKAPAKKTSKKAPAKKTVKKAPAKKAASKKVVGRKSEIKKPAPGASTRSVTKKKKTDRRVAPTVVSARKTAKKVDPSAKKTPRRKIDFANPRSVAAAAASSEVDKNGYVMINGRRVRAISTKGAGIKKKSRSKSASASLKAEAEVDVSKIKTHLARKELTAYKALLLEKRRHIVGMVSGLETEALRSSGGNLSNMPIHMADVGTDVFEQDFTLGMAATERELIVEIDAALERIVARTYGVCQKTGKPIPKARLQAKPWAKYTIEAARMAERNRNGD
jgi:DnaK suppressor protein